MKKSKILFIDDELEYLDAITEYFFMIGHETIKAPNGMEGLCLLQSEKPDIIFCDYKLPDIDGDEVLIRSKEIVPGVDCVIITAFRDDKVTADLISLGARKVMIKPLLLPQVKQAVDDILSDRRNKSGDI